MNTFEVGKRYICVAKCPELDRNKARHCCVSVVSNGTIAYMENHECPCGNLDKWEEIA